MSHLHPPHPVPDSWGSLMKRHSILFSAILIAACGPQGSLEDDAYEDPSDLSDHAPGAGDLSEDELSEAQSALVSSTVMVNECQSGTAGFIELYNAGKVTVDLYNDPSHCWFVDDMDGGGTPKLITDSNVNHSGTSKACFASKRGSSCALVAPGERVWIPLTTVNTTGDQCRLIVSGFTAGKCNKTFEDANVGGPAFPGKGVCSGRVRDGQGWSASAIACTPNAGKNGPAIQCAGGMEPGNGCSNGDPCVTDMVFDAGCHCVGGQPVKCAPTSDCQVASCTTQSGCMRNDRADGASCGGGAGACKAGVCGASRSDVVINELSGGSAGWVELYNTSSSAVDLSGWTIRDEGHWNVKTQVFITATVPSGTKLAAHGLLAIAFGGLNVGSADTVTLLTAGGALVDTHGNGWAGQSTSGKCFGRTPDGGAWATAALASCSKGASNAALPPPPTGSCQGGTFGGVAFSKSEECHAIDFLNRAPMSAMAMGDADTRVAYDCGPDGKCGLRRGVWKSLAQLESFDRGGHCQALDFATLKSSAAAWTDGGQRYDTVATTWTDRAAITGRVVSLEKVYVSKVDGGAGNGPGYQCAQLRDSPTATNYLTVCEYSNPYCDGCGPGWHLTASSTPVAIRGDFGWDKYKSRWTVEFGRRVAIATGCGARNGVQSADPSVP